MEKISKYIKLFFVEILPTIIIALAIFAIIYQFLVQPHRVDGQSMEPTFQNGDLILSDKISYRFSNPKRGDVIVFPAPQAPDKDYIKRIIGLPGERIRVNEGRVYINDIPLDESYLSDPFETEGNVVIRENEEFLIPVNEYVVMGDNRRHSSDSRSWGTVHKDVIIGKIWLRYWPTNSFRLFQQIKYQPTIPE